MLPGARRLRELLRHDQLSASPDPAPRISADAAALGAWYHRIELPDGTVTPGDRDQSLVYSLYESYLPSDVGNLRVLDLGANACGLAIEFARRGAQVTAVEYSRHYLTQAQFVLHATGLADRVQLLLGDVYRDRWPRAAVRHRLLRRPRLPPSAPTVGP